jgi:hypothetical protein
MSKRLKNKALPILTLDFSPCDRLNVQNINECLI